MAKSETAGRPGTPARAAHARAATLQHAGPKGKQAARRSKQAAAPAPRWHARTERRQSKRQEILVIARHMYAAEGYAAVSMRAVAQRLGFSKQAIYYYFPSKEDIFLALLEEGLHLLESQRPPEELSDPIENLKLPFWRYYEFSKSSPEYFELLWVDPAAPVLDWTSPRFQKFLSISQDTVRRMQRCVDEGLFPASLDIGWVANILWASVHGCAVIGLTQRPFMGDLDRLAADLLDAAIASLRQPPSRDSRPAGSAGAPPVRPWRTPVA